MTNKIKKKDNDITTTKKQTTTTQPTTKPYVVLVPSAFLIISLLSSTLLAFSVGRLARLAIITPPTLASLTTSLSSSSSSPPTTTTTTLSDGTTVTSTGPKVLPAPIIQDGKDVPRTIYTSKNFDTAASATASSMLVQKPRGDGSHIPRCRDDDNGAWRVCRGAAPDGSNGSARNVVVEEETDDDDDEEHLPAGQHLLVDIKNVEPRFLDDEERLAAAMVELCAVTGLTLLSYHCHGLEPMGVSCAGVLLESHVSFHTWPEEGVITLDLFTCGSGLLVPVLPIVLRLFGVGVDPVTVEEGEEVEEVEYIWAHKLRGFRNDKRNFLARDMGRDIYSVIDYDMKEEVATTQTMFQHIHVYDVINPRFHDLATYHKSLQTDTVSYESQNPTLFQPDRIVYLDGVMQSSRLGDEAYHEGLVHPGMFAHPNPQRVAIIGGGEGATLREVLKHDTIREVVMIEIDELMVEFSREHLKSWSDCSTLRGSAECCFDDERATIYYEDALQWFIQRYYDLETSVEDKFDVIIMDALDPQDNVEFADALYSNNVFLTSLYNALSDEGVILLQLGESPDPLDPPEEYSIDANRAKIVDLLDDIGMKAMHVYEEFHSNFLGAWTHLVACKGLRCDLNWYENSAEIELAIHKRLRRTHAGTSPLKFFDGATMKSYQIPHKVFENVYCRKYPMPHDCQLIYNKKYFKNTPTATAFDVRRKEDESMGVFATMDIAKGRSIGVDSVGTLLHVSSQTYERAVELGEAVKEASAVKALENYVHAYGYDMEQTGFDTKNEYFVDTSILSFVNNNQDENNVGYLIEYNKSQNEPSFVHMRQHISAYSPLFSRNRDFLFNGFDVALRDIHEGEEILEGNASDDTDSS